MNLPITPLTITAAAQLARSAGDAVASSVEQALSFAELFAASDSTSNEAVDSNAVSAESISQRLAAIGERLRTLLGEAGADLGFRIDLVASSGQLKLDSVHPEQEQIESALASDAELGVMFRELEQSLRARYPNDTRQGSLRLQLQGDDLTFDFSGGLFA